MDKKIKKSHIMFMPHMKLNDFISIDERCSKKTTARTSNEEFFYVNNPKQFTTLSKWIKNSNCKCWECSCNFVGPPVFIPIKLVKKEDNKMIIDTYGNFCWFNCAQKWINEHYKYDNSFVDKTEMLKVLYKIFTGEDIIKIPEAYDKTIMKQYCGECGITMMEYKEKNRTLNEIKI